MEEIRLEAVIDDEEFDGSKEEARELVKKFLRKTGDEITAEYSKQVDNDGNVIDKEIRGYTRQSETLWTSVAILLISNPEGVIQFLKWASDIPGLTIGFTVEGDIRIKIFSDINFTLIDNSTEYNIEKIGETKDYVVAKIPEEDWIQLYDDIYAERLEIDLPPEDEIGL